MREIKFRVWDFNLKKMYLPGKDAIVITETGVFADTGSWAPMQYTGLKDKNGVEIYEGDVVKDMSYYHNFTRTVEWGFHEDASSYKSQLGWNIWEEDELLVVGNVYENPEPVK